MKLLEEFRSQISQLGELKRVWFTTFNLGIEFFETNLLPFILGMDRPANRMDYESMQLELAARGIDLRIFCDRRMLEADQLKRTSIHIHPVLGKSFDKKSPPYPRAFDKDSLFHPKVIFLEDVQGNMVLGAGSANLTVSGWGRNQEVFVFRPVSNNRQYQQIKSFFMPLTQPLALEEEEALGTRRKFYGKDEDWSFVHSFQHKTFLEQLSDGLDVNELTVWSPYFSGDLPGLLDRINEVVDRNLKVALVPDRVSSRFIRALWTPELGDILAGGALSFHDYPVSRPDVVEMTHAKVWLASGNGARLAIGSWNFTMPGSASFEQRNVEAGILLDVNSGTGIAGIKLQVTENDFGSAELMLDEELVAPEYKLPFELQVSFDWEQGRYFVSGKCFDRVEGKPFFLRLPGVEKMLRLDWAERRSDDVYLLSDIEIAVPDNETLLADHCYVVERNGDVEYRGLILETGQGHRRGQGYDSLKELLDSLVNNEDPKGGTNTKLRKSLRNNAGSEDDDAVPSADPGVDSLSYFRMFHAFEQFRKELQRTSSMDELEKRLFVYPGCLQVLATKVREQIETSGNTVFNWFLVQEVNALYLVALDARERHREIYARKNPPNKEKWDSLKLKKNAVSLPLDIRSNAQYMRQLREECSYVG